MRFVTFLLFLLLSLATREASAQFNGCAPGLCAPYAGATCLTGGYQGAGDIAPSATVGLSIQAWTAATCGNRVANVCVSGTCADMFSSLANGRLVAQLINGTLCPNTSTTACVVKTWYDQTTSGGCAGSCDVTRSTLINNPILTTTCPSPLTVCLLFPFTATPFTYLQMAGNLTLSPTPFSVMAVGTVTSGSTNSGVYAGFNNAGSLAAALANVTVASCDGVTNYTATSADGTWFSRLQTCLATTYDIYLNGSSQGAHTWTPTSSPSAAYVGGRFASGGAVLYEVEAGIWKSDLTSNAVALSANQRARFGWF